MRFIKTLETLKPADNIEKIDFIVDDKVTNTIFNEEATKGSLKVIANILDFDNGNIDKKLAEKGLDLFCEYKEI